MLLKQVILLSTTIVWLAISHLQVGAVQDTPRAGCKPWCPKKRLPVRQQAMTQMVQSQLHRGRLTTIWQQLVREASSHTLAKVDKHNEEVKSQKTYF